MQASATADSSSNGGAQTPVSSQPVSASAVISSSRPIKHDQQSSAAAATRPVSASRSRPPEEDASEYWSFELFGCLTDWRLCCATFCLPCYTIGRNAEYFGDDGSLTGLLYGLGLCAVSI
jgi:hypothetical protein